MKRIILLTISLLLFGCTQSNEINEKVLNSNYSEEIQNTNLFSDEAEFLDNEVLLYLNIKIEDFEFIDIYTANSVDDPSLYIVAEAKPKKIQDCKGQINYYLENRLSAYMDYNPDAEKMINNTLNADYDNYIIRIISTDNELILSKILE